MAKTDRGLNDYELTKEHTFEFRNVKIRLNME